MPNTKFKRYCLLQIGLYLRLQETQLLNFLPQINICININIINIMFSLMLDYCYATYRSKCNIGSTSRIGIFPNKEILQNWLSPKQSPHFCTRNVRS